MITKINSLNLNIKLYIYRIIIVFVLFIYNSLAYTQICTLNDKEFKDTINEMNWKAYSKPDSILKTIEKILKTEKCDALKTGYLLNIKATTYLVLADYQKCIKTGQEIILIGQKLNEPIIEAMGNAQIYASYISLEKYSQAIIHNQEQINCLKKTNNNREIAWAYYNLSANLYNYFPDSLKPAFNYILKAEEFIDSNEYNIIISIKQMKGLINQKMGNIDFAKTDFHEGLALCKKTNHNATIASMYATYGLHLEDHDIDSSIVMYELSNEYYEKDYILAGVAGNYLRLGDLYTKNSNTHKAHEMYNLSIIYSEKANSPYWKILALKASYELFAKQKNYKNAYSVLMSYYLCKDSVSSIDIKNQIEKREISFNYEKKSAADSVAFAKEAEIKNIEIAKQKAEIKAKRNQQYALFGGLFLVVVFAGFMYNRFKVTQKQKTIIEAKERETHAQKEIIEEKHKEITDSINYAERIQRSFLATNEMLESQLKQYFVFFRPKDVVSGDFYWAGELNNGNFAFSCADSTGHGVPGAIMSILNISSLEKSIEKETEPHKILFETRRIIIDRLKKDGSEEGGKDGMDCSLLVLDKERKQLSFAAANNPVFIIRNQELLEFKPDKMPVGKHDNDTESFTLQTTQLQKDDVIYTLTDGFPDQFGGDKGKKYMIKSFKELLLQIAHLPMPEQEQKLAEEFDNWKGVNEQVDDVCIIGVRI